MKRHASRAAAIEPLRLLTASRAGRPIYAGFFAGNWGRHVSNDHRTEIASQTWTGNPRALPHIPALDGLRGLAILLVLAHHLLWSNPVTGSHWLDLIQRVQAGTYAGVNLFFALSGFLITSILLETLAAPHYFRTFYTRRCLRIFPLYYGSLAVLLLLTHRLNFHWNGWQYYFLTYTQNLPLWRMSIPWDIGKFNINHFWTLQVEEQFYLVWPLIVYRLKRPAMVAGVALAATLPILALRVAFVLLRGHPHFTWVYLPFSPTFSCADNLLFGCALAALLRTPAAGRVLRLAPLAFVVCLSALGLLCFVNRGFEWQTSLLMPTVGFTLLGLTSASLIASTLRAGSCVERIFAQRVLRFFGRYSYGIYVFHYSLAGFLTAPLRDAVLATLRPTGGSAAAALPLKLLSVLLPALALALLSVLAAVLSYHLLEAPFLHLKRFWRYSPEPSRPPVPLRHRPPLYGLADAPSPSLVVERELAGHF
jgi:peptidoglycan/LPS O-acetylase OafA/YrhL